MIARAALAAFQKPGSAAWASSFSSSERRVSTLKITSHLCQSFAQLAEAGDDFLDGRHGLPRWAATVRGRMAPLSQEAPGRASAARPAPGPFPETAPKRFTTKARRARSPMKTRNGQGRPVGLRTPKGRPPCRPVIASPPSNGFAPEGRRAAPSLAWRHVASAPAGPCPATMGPRCRPA